MKYDQLKKLFRRIAGVALLCLLALSFSPPPARAGMTFELHIYQYGSKNNYTYYFDPLLATNSVGANVSFGNYALTSSGIPTNGSSSFWKYDSSGFNPADGDYRNSYGDFNTMAHEITNGVWSLFVTNATITNVYHFKVALNISSNGLPKVLITAPLDGAVNVTNQPVFTWQGPGNYSSVVVSVFNTSQSLPASQTSWLSTRVLYQGPNNFNVEYLSNSTTAAVASVPTNSLAQPFSGWVSTNVLDVSYSCQFSVGLPDASGGIHTLVAHYPFDATSGPVLSAAVDTSGNGFDMSTGGTFGSQGGDSLTSGSAAGIGAVLFQDGDNQSGSYLGWTNPTPPALLSALAGSFSVSCWIKTTQNIAWNTAPAYYGAGIVSADNSGQANDVVPIALTGGSIAFNTGGDTEDVTLNSVASVNDGNYHHIVVTRNQATGQKIIYIDGQFDSFASGSTNLLSASQKLTIGALADAGNPNPNDGSYNQGFDGKLDDLQIYSGVLSAGDVADLFASPGSTVANGGGTGSGGHSIVARYEFEETNSPGLDSSGHGNDSTCGGGDGDESHVDTFSTDAAVGSYSREFLGHTFICFGPPADSFSHLTNAFSGSFSVSAWVKTTQSYNGDDDPADSGASLLFAQDNNTDSTIPLALTGSKIAIGVNGHNGNNTTLHSQTSVNDGQYHQIAVTRNRASGLLKVYVDGNLEGTANGPAERLYIPSIIALGGYFNDYNGLLDDVQIYSGVLSDTDVASLYANPGTTVPDVAGGNTNGLVVHHDFDEGVVLAPDVSGNNNSIVHAGNFGGSGPSISTDTAAGSGSISFDGGSYLTASSNLLSTLASDFTVSLWLKTTQDNGDPDDYAFTGAGIISADVFGLANDLVPVALTGGQVAFNTGDTADGHDGTINSSATVNDGSWHHVVVCRNQITGEKDIYIDGVLDTSDFNTTALLNAPVLLTIGAIADASNPDPSSPDDTGYNGYQGLLDDVQIYNRVIGSNEVAYLFANPGSVLGSSGGITPATPVITLNPFNQTNYPGYSVALLAAATSNAAITWQWFKVGAGSPIPNATSTLFIPTNSGTAGVAGSYYAVATDNIGSANTTTALVSFVSAPLPPDWSRATNSPYHAEFDTNVIKDYYGGCAVDSAGNVYVADQYVGDVIVRSNFVTLNTLTAVGTNGGAALIKHAADGTPLWGVGLTNNQPSSFSYANSVALAPGNGAYLASILIGTNWLGTNRYANNGGDSVLLSRFDANGSNVWSRLIGQTGLVFCYYNCLVSDAAGNLTVAGVLNGTADFGGTNLTASDLMGFLAQYNANGGLLWAQVLPGTPRNLAYSAGRIYLALPAVNSGGTTNLNFGSLSNLTDRAYGLVAVNATNGQALWLRGVGELYGARTNGGFADDVPLVSVSGPDVFLTGTAYGSTALFGGLSVPLPGGRYQYFARYDTNGNPQVATSFGSTTTMPWASAANSSGVYISGDFDNYSQFGNDIVAAPVVAPSYLGRYYFTQPFLAKFDRNGNTLWARNGMGSALANFRGITTTSDGVWASGIVLLNDTFHPAQFGTHTIFSDGYLDESGTSTIFFFTQGGFLAKITESSPATPVTLINPHPVGANFQFQFLSESGFSHNILYRTNLVLGSWQTNSTVSGDGTVKTISVPFTLFSPAKQGFIRVSTQ